MSDININGTALGSTLMSLINADDIVPGSDVSYQVCKALYEWHPIGKKMADSPIFKAMSKKRNIVVPNSPGERVKEAFEQEWEKLHADRYIFNTVRLSRIYGIASIAILEEDVDAGEPLDFARLPKAHIAFNMFDPLNTAGSLVLNQNPNEMDFLKTKGIMVNGKAYHRSRSVILMNEDPIYISYTTSAFGFVGRSVYQRALYPLKSFLQTMITDDMITRKAGVLVAKIKQAGSIIDNAMIKMTGIKRNILKEAKTNNVISINPEEMIETLNMQNLDGAYSIARKNILDNIAAAADMPATLLKSDTLTEGFGEGTEDAKMIAEYIDGIRERMQPLYEFFDKIVQHRAWDEDFYKTIQADFPDEYGSKSYNEAFYQWQNTFRAEWPSLLQEPESERIKVDETRLRSTIALMEVLIPQADPDNKARIIEWAADTFNAQDLLFESPLLLDYEALANYTPTPEQQAEMPDAPSQMGKI